jgi:hypothetical protein
MFYISYAVYINAKVVIEGSINPVKVIGFSD